MSDEYGYEDLSDEDRAEEVADLQARMAALQAPAPTATAPAPPPPHGADYVALVNAATSAEEVELILARRRALSEPVEAAPLSDPWAEVRSASREATWKRPTPDAEPPRSADYATDIARAQSPEEVMAAVRAAGLPTSDPVSW